MDYRLERVALDLDAFLTHLLEAPLRIEASCAALLRVRIEHDVGEAPFARPCFERGTERPAVAPSLVGERDP